MVGRTKARMGAASAAALGSLLATAQPASAQFAGMPSLVNVNNAGVPANAESWSVAISADGTLVAFASDADNLVPLDTNGDSDVFLHDAVTGITSRLSVNFQGEEAMGDSDCPSLSADGRWVAFRSRAWNMVQGAQNIGPQWWQVYLRDRQGPQTIRVSMPLGGGASTADSGCPSISADGQRVAFASDAADLVADDHNGLADVFVYDVPSGSLVRASVADDESEANGPAYDPAISGDGTVVAFASQATNLTPDSFVYWPFLLGQVYVRDLAAETTNLISRALLAPSQAPNAESCCPRISTDGRTVLFRSSAGNLTSKWFLPPRRRVYVRDRLAGVTEGVEPLSLGAGPCGWLSDPLFCDASMTKGATISADGRFVAFMSGSHLLLPENPPSFRDQIYIQDRLTRRLRRVTVDPSGYPINAYPCGGSSSTLALSADGRVLALAGENIEALGLPEADGGAVRDVVRLESTCDPEGGSCRELSQCPGTPTSGCEPARRSRLRIRRNPPLSARRDRFYWRWVGVGEGEEGLPFVDPTDGRYQLCVYTGETMNAQIDAGIPAGAPWRRIEKGWKRKDRGGALELVRLRRGPGRSLITVRSASAALDMPYLPLEAPQGVTIQLHESTTDRCWESVFPASALSANRRGGVTSKGVVPGAVRADVR